MTFSYYAQFDARFQNAMSIVSSIMRLILCVPLVLRGVNRQVEEITELEYFKHLTESVRSLRQRGTKAGSGT
jgi:hypothetical protein